MRVYFISHSATRDHLGGSELSMLHIIDRWIEHDPEFTPTIVSPARNAAVNVEALRRGWRTIVVPYEGWVLFDEPGGRLEAAFRAHRDFDSTLRLIEHMKADRPDLVVTNTLVSPWGAYAAASLGISHVWFVREFGDVDQGLRFPADRANTLTDIGLLSTMVIPNSDAVRASLAEFIPAAKLEVVHPAVDPLRVAELASAPLPMNPFPQSNVDLKVTFVSRITRTKGQWRLVEAVGLLAQRGIRVALCFVGSQVEGDSVALLQDRARRLGIADLVTFVGEHSNPHPFTAAADICVTASDREAFGRTTLEYMVLGKPVIGSDSGGTPELIVDGETGYLVDPDDLDAWADRIHRYVQSPALVGSQGAAGKIRAARFSDAATFERLFALLRHAAKQPGLLLPQTVVAWLRGPALYVPRRSVALTVTVRVRRFVRRILRAIRHPLAVLRRRWLRLRARRAGTGTAVQRNVAVGPRFARDDRAR